jgi:hypothetical protein
MDDIASRAYFEWRHYHSHLSEDPQAVWAAAWQAGGRAAIHQSGRLLELVPLMLKLLVAFEDGRIEAEVRASDRRWQPSDKVSWDEEPDFPKLNWDELELEPPRVRW